MPRRMQRADARPAPPALIPPPVARVNGGAGRPPHAEEESEGNGQNLGSPLVR